MKNQRPIVLIAILFIIVGCATPAEVKQLSVKQSEYFDAAIEAVSLQSEALILASEKLANNAKQKIEREAEAFDDSYVELLAGNLTEEDVQDAISNLASGMETASSEKAKIDNNLAKIKAKSDELKQYLAKMKEVHKALDAYLQSEKAGEKVVEDVLNQPSVNDLLATTNNLIPKVQGGIDDLNELLNQIGE